MKKEIKKIILVFLSTITIIFTACEEWLDEPKPEAEIPLTEIGSGTSSLDGALTGAWAWWMAPQTAPGNTFIYPEALGDYLRRTKRDGNRAFTESYERDFQDNGYGLIGEVTQRSSRAENLANLVVKIARENPPSDDAWASNGKRILGEALFLRAWIHWEYTLMMADQWNTKNPAANVDARGPLVRFKPILSTDDIGQARTPLKAMYDSLIANLKQAEELLPEFYDPGIHDPSFSVRANKFAASALLAKVYWQQNDFDNALIQINKVLGSSPGISAFPLAQNFSDIYNRFGLTGTSNTANKGEVILEYIASEPAKIATRDGQAIANAWWRKDGNNNRFNLYFGPFFQDLTDFDKANDRRFKELINSSFTQSTFSGWSTKKFVSNANLVFIRSAELVLMRAEIFARKNQIQNALADLNMVRGRAGLEPLTASIEQNELINEIIRERVREMHAEGYRSHELKRLGSLTDGEPNEVMFQPGDRNPAQGDCGASSDCTPMKWNDRRLTWPIPDGELQVNPLAKN